jgi:hypothetical protein
METAICHIIVKQQSLNICPSDLYILDCHVYPDRKVQGGSNMTGTNYDLFTHK